ncbi:MAG: hypothetical protein H0U23_12435 [Blastocatellia bacterium]|nr:hypothetical protein [Blastocatellia bacterium]
MRALIVLLFCSALLAEAEERIPGEAPVSSPGGTFRITQRLDDSWHTTIHFKKPGVRSIVLADDYSWAGRFFVSPNDQWLLYIQKDASGSNTSFLFRVEPTGRIWRMEQPFGAAAFTFLEDAHGVSTAHLYHTGIDFIGWDMAAGALRFSIHASSNQYEQAGVNEQLIYDLRKDAFRRSKP